MSTTPFADLIAHHPGPLAVRASWDIPEGSAVPLDANNEPFVSGPPDDLGAVKAVVVHPNDYARLAPAAARAVVATQSPPLRGVQPRRMCPRCTSARLCTTCPRCTCARGREPRDDNRAVCLCCGHKGRAYEFPWDPATTACLNPGGPPLRGAQSPC